MHETTERLKVLQDNRTYEVMCVKLSDADVGSAMTDKVHSSNPVCKCRLLHMSGLLTCGMNTSMLYSAQTVRFRTGVIFRKMISLPSYTTY